MAAYAVFMKKNIPNSITLLNLFLGCCALASVLYGQFVNAFWFSFASGVADYLDGTLARALKVKSPLGEQLDSLADMVSFGVVPGAILYMLLVRGLAKEPDLPVELTIAALPAFLVTIFAAVRLAIFNIDTRQTENFIGMPTPACAMYTVGLMMIFHYDSYHLAGLVTNPIFLFVNIILLSWLMVSELPIFGLKFRNLSWKDNHIRFIFGALALVLLLLFREVAFSLIVIVYVLLSCLDYFFLKTATVGK